MRLLIALVVLTLGCSSKKDEPEPKEESGGLLGGLAGKAKSLGDDVAGKAKSIGDDVAGKAKSIGSDVIDKAIEVAVKAGDISGDAFSSGKQLKDELRGKAELAKLDYDLAIDSRTESESDHAARIAGMKQLKVGAYTVGIEQDSKHPLGSVYKWQFRITWRVLDGRAVRLSLFTNHELPDLELATALLTVVPLAERMLK